MSLNDIRVFIWNLQNYLLFEWIKKLIRNPSLVRSRLQLVNWLGISFLSRPRNAIFFFLSCKSNSNILLYKQLRCVDLKKSIYSKILEWYGAHILNCRKLNFWICHINFSVLSISAEFLIILVIFLEIWKQSDFEPSPLRIHFCNGCLKSLKHL